MCLETLFQLSTFMTYLKGILILANRWASRHPQVQKYENANLRFENGHRTRPHTPVEM